MKRVVYLVALIAMSLSLNAQEAGKVYGRIFANFKNQINSDKPSLGYEAKRAEIGYKRKLEGNLSAELRLDIGSPDDVSEYSLSKRFAYFRRALVSYKHHGVKINFGIIPTNINDMTEKFWGKRYIEKAPQDRFKIGPSGDLGTLAYYKFNEFISFDVGMFNGEGYSKLQGDDNFKYSGGFSITNYDGIYFRAYVDHLSGDYPQSSFVGTLAYEFENYFKTYISYDKQLNNKTVESNDLEVYSAFLEFIFQKDISLFARYDILKSNLNDKNTPWNLSKDGSSLISGIDYKYNQHLRLSLNYRDWYSRAENGEDKQYVYLNVQVKF